MDWKDFTWTREPAAVTMAGEQLKVTTKPQTDLWQKTYYHFINDNAPVLTTPVADEFFTLTVKTTFTDSHTRFDQCGVVLYQDSENWLKASTEYETATMQHLGSVVTNGGYSDWATQEISGDVKTMWYRLSRRQDDFRIEASVDGEHFQQLRIAHLAAATGAVNVGVYACSPENSSFEAVFADLTIGECVWAAHDGQAPNM